MRLCAAVVTCALLLGAKPAAPQEPAPQRAVAVADTLLDDAFQSLYRLRFDEARAKITSWEVDHSSDPRGPAAEAASYLFEEFYAQGVMTSEFFTDDKKLLDGKPLTPDPQRQINFLSAVDRAQKLAALRLQTNKADPNALFALAISHGMLSDYDSIIMRKQLDALHNVKEAESDAVKLLAVDPDSADADVPIGIGNYIIGCLPGYKRAIVWFGGVHGDRAGGMDQLRVAADRGHYLKPFAQLLLALAALREKQPELARNELNQLVSEFPDNALFARELAKLAAPRVASDSH
jgi:hypothetical protein